MSRKIVDLKESINGDLIIENGDLADTGIDYSLAAFQLIRTILNTKPTESGIYPNMGFYSNIYEGMPNTQSTAKEITKAIKQAIKENSVFYDSEIQIESFPVSKSSIAFNISVLTTEGDTKNYNFAYDTAENRIKSMIL